MAPMVPKTTREIYLTQWPKANKIEVDTDFAIKEVEIPSPLPENSVLVKLIALSNDPAQRTWISDADPERHYVTPITPGNTMGAFGIGRVISSSHSDYNGGDLLLGVFGWREYAVVPIPSTPTSFGPTKLPAGTDPADFLSLGFTALTAYFGLLSPRVVGATSSDKIVVVSGAAGATGSAATQIAKNVLGIELVIGIAGSKEKCELIKSQGGCDIAFNYKTPGWKEEFQKLVLDKGGIDVYFDNVGGEILELCLESMKKEGRIAACGAISGYDDPTKASISFKSWGQIIFQALKVQGFLASQFSSEFPKAQSDLAEWTKAGKIKPLKTVFKAKFEEVPKGLEMLLQGKNTGKLITILE